MSADSAQTTGKQENKKTGFKGPKKRMTNKAKAEALIDSSAPPVSLSSALTPFRPDASSDILTEIDPMFPERFGSFFLGHFRVQKDVKFRYREEGEDGDWLLASMYSLLAILNASACLKLIHATPRSQVAVIEELSSFLSTSMAVPSSYLMLLNLLGKCDLDDTRVRILNNGAMVRVFALKSIWNASQLKDFQDNSIFFGKHGEGLTAFRGLKSDEVLRVIFDDDHSVKQVRYIGRKKLDDLLVTTHQIDLGEESSITVSPPYLHPRANMDQFIAWLAAIHYFPDAVRSQLAVYGMLSRFSSAWLNDLSNSFQTFDSRYSQSWIRATSPRELLASANLYPYSDYFNDDDSFRACLWATIAYCSTVTHKLQHYIDFKDMGNVSFGHPAQVISTPMETREQFRDRSVHNKNIGIRDVSVHSAESNLVMSNRKISTPGPIMIAAAFAMFYKPLIRESYSANTSTPLSAIANDIAGQSLIAKR